MSQNDDITILVVNDSTDHLALMGMALRKAGFGVLTASDGAEAFGIAEREHVELIVSDVMMPNVSGIELCRLVRGHPGLKWIPILLVSALRKDTATVVEGLRSGADGYLESPYDPAHLIAAVARLVERKRAEDMIRDMNEELEVRVAERTAQLAKANRELEREVAERRLIESALEKARDAALEAARLKSEFLANVSHEIRTPMHAISGMVGLLLGTPLKPRQREYAEVIKEGSESLLAVINDVLDLSKIEAGKLRVEQSDFDLTDVVNGVAQLFAERAGAKGLELNAAVGADVPTLLRGDPGRLRQVLTNLLGNAVKFTARGAVAIRVNRVTEQDRRVTLRFEVSDTGIGVTPEAQRRIFLPFAQADGSVTRAYGGTGLGLAISRQLVELMGGEIGVESEAGRGSAFWFTVRLGKQPVAEPPPHGASGLDGIRALVMDDNPDNRETLLRHARMWNMRPAAAGDPDGALAALREAERAGDPFAFVLIESQPTGAAAAELARRIRAVEHGGASTPRLVLFTPRSLSQAEEAECEDLFDACLVMPVRRQQLQDCLRSLAASERVRKTGPAASGGAEPEHPPLPPGRSVLVAEDNPVNQKLITYLLEELGYGAVVVPNGARALEACAGGEYAMVLMDCQMPEMDGYAATAELRRREGALRHTPVIALTADAMPGTRERCLAAGMDGYLSKPFTREELEAVIAEWDDRSFVRAADPAAPAEGAAVDDVLDLRLIEHLRGFREQGDNGIIVQLIDTFLQDINARRDSISEAYGSHDLERVRREAHALKGSAGFFGAVRLSKVCAELMDSATGGELPPAHQALKQLDDELLSITRKLEVWRWVHPA